MVSRIGDVVDTVEDDFSSDSIILSDSKGIFSCEPTVLEQVVVCCFLLYYGGICREAIFLGKFTYLNIM